MYFFLGILRAMHHNDNESFPLKGADCFCPIECEENTYIPEVSSAYIRPNGSAVEVKLAQYD